MKNIIYPAIVLLSFILSGKLYAQQNDELRFNYHNQFIRNPAAISVWDRFNAGVYYQQAFTGIDNAPVVSFAGLQYPIPNQNISFGGALYYETSGVLQNINLNIGACYKLKSIFLENDYLALGVGALINQLRINGSKIILNNEQDPLSTNDGDGALGINVGLGFFYSSQRNQSTGQEKTVVWQLGLSGGRTIPQDLNLQNFQYQERLLLTSFIRGIFQVNNNIELSPMLETFYEGGQFINSIATVQASFSHQILFGLSYDVHNALGIQIGYNLWNSGGEKLGLFTDKSLIITVNGNIPLGKIENSINSGYGVGVQYLFGK